MFTIGNVEPTFGIGVFTEMPVKSCNRFLPNFTLDLWTDRKKSESRSFSGSLLQPTVVVFKDYVCTQSSAPSLAWKHWPCPILHNCKHQQIRPWKCSCSFHVYPLITFSVLSTLIQSWGIPHPGFTFNDLQLEEFTIFDVKIMVHKIRWLTQITAVGLVPHLHRNLLFTDKAR